MTNTKLGFAAILLTACGGGEPVAVDMPESLRGAYGQTLKHAALPTLGLEVDGKTLRLDQLTITVLSGEPSGATDYQVHDAEVNWQRGDHKPKHCKGTVSRQGDTLLVRLFKLESSDTCESILDGEWRAWSESDAVPAALHGTYGGDARDFDADVGIRVTDRAIAFMDRDAQLAIEKVIVWAGKPDELIVRKATWSGHGCAGTLVRKDERMTLQLEVAGDAPEGAFCPGGSGVAWTVDAAALPKAALDNTHVHLEFAGDKLVMTSGGAEGMRCEQPILRTSPRSVSESGGDGIPVVGGTVVVLGRATPSSGAAWCRQRLVNVARSECERIQGAPCPAGLAESAVDESLREMPLGCPRQLVFGDKGSSGRKAALLPQDLPTQTCWDMTGTFVGG